MDGNNEILNFIYQNSEMHIQGSRMGIIDATKRINQYDDADKEILDLATRLLKFEKDNQEEWKKFL